MDAIRHTSAFSFLKIAQRFYTQACAIAKVLTNAGEQKRRTSIVKDVRTPEASVGNRATAL
jgi:hypothetical protein